MPYYLWYKTYPIPPHYGGEHVFGVALVHRKVPNLVVFYRFSSHSNVAGICLNMGCPKCEGWWWATWANMCHFGCELGPVRGWCGAAWANLVAMWSQLGAAGVSLGQRGPTRWPLGATLDQWEGGNLGQL